MTVNEILTLVNFIINKEVSGDALIPANYNTLLSETNIVLFSELWDKYYSFIGQPSLQYVLSDSPLATFMQTATVGCTPTTGIGSLPTDIVHLLSLESTITGLNIELITPGDAARRRSSVMTIPAHLHPYGFVIGSNIQVYPYDQSIAQGGGAGVQIPLSAVYLRQPATPYYDYCQSTVSLKRVFMPAGSKILEMTVPGVRYDLYQGSTLLQANVTRTGLVSGGNTGGIVYTSVTTELEWRIDMHDRFVNRILSKTGISLSEEKVAMYAEQLKKTE